MVICKDMVIWKYELEITDVQSVQMPEGAKIISVANQGGVLCLWAMVDPMQATRKRAIVIIGTGNPIRSAGKIKLKFIGTALIEQFVWHVFEQRLV